MNKFIVVLFFSLCCHSLSAQTIKYTYDNLGRLTQAIYPDNSVLTYTYDASGNRVTTKTKMTKSGNANLSALVPNSGVLSPIFSQGITSYKITVLTAITSIAVTPTAAEANATIKVNGLLVTSGSPSTNIPLVIGSNNIVIMVTAQDGATTKTYMVTVTRPPSNNAILTTIKLTPYSALVTTNGPGNANYKTTVANIVSSVTLTATAKDPTAIIKVNGSAVISGTASGEIALNVGPNTITTLVTAQDGNTVKTYIITVTRAAHPSMNSFYEPVAVVKPNDGALLNGDGIVVHQGLSPNGDSRNDVLIIEGLALYPDNTLSIMNRNGKLIYHAKGYDNINNVFDGHSNKNGRMQQAGTYFYSLDYKVGEQTRHKTGFIILKY